MFRCNLRTRSSPFRPRNPGRAVRWPYLAALVTIFGLTPVGAQSPNDLCFNAIPLTDGVTQTFDTTFDSSDGPSPTCGGSLPPTDIWYTYTASCTGTATATMCGSSYDTRLAVYPDADCPPTNEIACNDDSCGLQTQLDWPVVAGSTYRLQVCGFNSASGAGQITVTCAGGSTDIPIFHYTGGPCPPELLVVNGNPANVECGVPRSRLFDLSSPLAGSLASGGGGFGTFPGPDNAGDPGILVRLNDFAVDPSDPRAGIVIICLNIQLPPTPPTFRFIKTKIRRAAAFEISPAAQAVIDSGRKNYWAAQARKIAMGAASIDPAAQMAADRMRRMFKSKNNTDYDTLLDGTRYMPEACEETTTIEFVPGAPGATITIYIVFQIGNFSTMGEFLSEIEVSLSEVSNDPSGSPNIGNVMDNAIVLENVDDVGPVAVVDFAGGPGLGQFSVPSIDLNTPGNLNPQNALWITNSSNETLQLNVPGHPPALLPPDSQMAFNDLALGGVISATGSLGSSSILDLNGTGGPPNDHCPGATFIGQGSPAAVGNLLTASPDGASTCGLSTGNRDVWYAFTAPNSGSFLFDTCGTHDAPGLDLGMDTVLNVFDACGGMELACNDDNGSACAGIDAGAARDSSVSVLLSAGQTVLVRVSHFGTAIANGDFVLNVGQDCGGIGPLTCTYDCATNQVFLAWTNNPNAFAGYDILENGLLVGSAPAGASSFNLPGPAVGTNTYEVQWACALGGSGTAGICTVNVQPPIFVPPSATDVILHLEGIDDAGDLGLVDSGAALEAALLANGRVVQRIAPANFDGLIASGCLDLSNAQTLWVMTGTFPRDYRLTLGEGNALAALAASGAGIYFEAADHWGFTHLVTGLDQRDGVDPTGNQDGNDTFGQMDGANAALAGLDLSSQLDIAYTQDQAGNDFTDRLAVTGGDAPAVSSAEVIWTNSDDSMTGELPYVTGVIAVHSDGGRMISTSWEFGGFGGDPVLLAGAYLVALGRDGTPPLMIIAGDPDGTGTITIGDAIILLSNLFPPVAAGPFGAAPFAPGGGSCSAALDCNSDNLFNIADPIYLLAWLFAGGPPPPAWGGGLPACHPASVLLGCLFPPSSCP